MSSVSARIGKVDLGRALNRGAEARERIVMAVTLMAIADTDKYVPYLEGGLSKSANLSSVPEEGIIRYDAKGPKSSVSYAAAQYYQHPNKTITPHKDATMRWFEVSKAANLDRWLKTAQLVARKKA